MTIEAVLVISTLLGDSVVAPDPIAGDVLNLTDQIDSKLSLLSDQNILETDEDSESQAIQAIIESESVYGLIDTTYAFELSAILKESEDFTYTPNLNDDFFTGIERNNQGLTWASNPIIETDISIRDDLIDNSGLIISPSIEPLGSSRPSFGYLPGNGGGSDDDENTGTKFELIQDYSVQKCSVIFNGKMDGKVFIGIRITRDACISFYNSIAKLFNTENLWTAIDITSFIIEIISALQVSFPVAWNTVVTIFTGLWNGIVNMLSFIPSIVAQIIRAVLLVLGYCTISVLSGMFVCGAFNSGFAAGLKINSIFNWQKIWGPCDC